MNRIIHETCKTPLYIGFGDHESACRRDHNWLNESCSERERWWILEPIDVTQFNFAANVECYSSCLRRLRWIPKNNFVIEPRNTTIDELMREFYLQYFSPIGDHVMSSLKRSGRWDIILNLHSRWPFLGGDAWFTTMWRHQGYIFA